MNDRFRTTSDSLTAPARRAFAILPHDSEELPLVTKAVIVGLGGEVVLRAQDSDSDVTISAASGQMLPIRVSHVRATGTTAGNLVGLS